MHKLRWHERGSGCAVVYFFLLFGLLFVWEHVRLQLPSTSEDEQQATNKEQQTPTLIKTSQQHKNDVRTHNTAQVPAKQA